MPGRWPALSYGDLSNNVCSRMNSATIFLLRVMRVALQARSHCQLALPTCWHFWQTSQWQDEVCHGWWASAAACGASAHSSSLLAPWCPALAAPTSLHSYVGASPLPLVQPTHHSTLCLGHGRPLFDAAGCLYGALGTAWVCSGLSVRCLALGGWLRTGIGTSDVSNVLLCLCFAPCVSGLPLRIAQPL